MGGGGKGGSSDASGMFQAMASVQAAQQAYQFGTQELQWAQQQWGQEWPYMQQAAQLQLQGQQQTLDFSKNQEQFYASQYQPMESAYNKMVSNWASPQQIAENAGQAMANVNESVNAQKASAQSQLEGYGVNPGATRFASLGAAMGVQGGAAAAGAGTQAIQNTKLQQMQMMAGAINTGRGFPTAVGNLTGTSANAGAAATSGLSTGLNAGANAMTAGASLYNAGANNMGVYVNAVNGYNQSQAQFAQANAMETAGLGSALGGIFGMFGSKWLAKGGPIERFQDGGDVGAMQQPQPPLTPSPQAPLPIPPRGGTPGGFIAPQMSPSGGQVEDDVDAKLTVGEFVMPKDVVKWKGKEYFYKEIDKARQQEMAADSRGDIGGEPVMAIPSRNPAFVSRPNAMPGTLPAAMPAAMPSRATA